MHGQQYSGSLFFHLNGKQNQFKDSPLTHQFDDEGEKSHFVDSDNMMDIIMNKALPIIQNSITESIEDYSCTAKELETQRKTDKNTDNSDLIDKLYIHSCEPSIDCDMVLGEIPKMEFPSIAINTQKRGTRSQSSDEYDGFILPSTVNTWIHPQLIPQFSMHHSLPSTPEEKSSHLSPLPSQIPSINPMNPKSFEPDELNVDRNDNNSWRCEYVRFDKNWWMNTAVFDDDLEFEYDPSPEFIYYGVEV